LRTALERALKAIPGFNVIGKGTAYRAPSLCALGIAIAESFRDLRKFFDSPQLLNAGISSRQERKFVDLLFIFAAHDYLALPEYVEPALSPLSRPDIAADYPLVLTNGKFTTYVHSQQRARRVWQSVAGADGGYSSGQRGALRHREQRVDDHRKPARGDQSQGACDQEYLARRRLLPAWLVAGVQRTRTTGLQSV